jgi:hypothetical protein
MQQQHTSINMHAGMRQQQGSNSKLRKPNIPVPSANVSSQTHDQIQRHLYSSHRQRGPLVAGPCINTLVIALLLLQQEARP